MERLDMVFDMLPLDMVFDMLPLDMVFDMLPLDILPLDMLPDVLLDLLPDISLFDMPFVSADMAGVFVLEVFAASRLEPERSLLRSFV
jgi:hypothetical protein